jgi:hypothetical protein
MKKSNDATDLRFGFWSALSTAVTTAMTFAMAILTPPLSGQLCAAGCFRYPYLEVAGRFPRDYYWLFLALVSILSFLAFMVALAGRARAAGQPFTRLGLLLGSMGGLTLLGDYYVQLAVIQPSLLAGESDGIALLTQYNPHGLFIALEELGYLLISLALACMVPALSTATRLERIVRRLFLGGLVLNAGALTFFVFSHGHSRGYLFELATISIDWLVLIAAALLMAVIFRRELKAHRGLVVDPVPGHAQAAPLQAR